jgi:hypothetical protein
MNTEQERDFQMPTLALTAGLFASVASGLVASFAILIVQLRIERARIQLEARYSKARRLRNKADGTEVTAPSLPEGPRNHYHGFLSHVWGYGCRS